jgi:hypothetical protein
VEGVAQRGYGYSSVMAARFRTRWVVVVFVVIGGLIALWLIVRGLDDGQDLPEEEGTVPALLI